MTHTVDEHTRDTRGRPRPPLPSTLHGYCAAPKSSSPAWWSALSLTLPASSASSERSARTASPAGPPPPSAASPAPPSDGSRASPAAPARSSLSTPATWSMSCNRRRSHCTLAAEAAAPPPPPTYLPHQRGLPGQLLQLVVPLAVQLREELVQQPVVGRRGLRLQEALAPREGLQHRLDRQSRGEIEPSSDTVCDICILTYRDTN